jgi:adenine nucleotide transporter 17
VQREGVTGLYAGVDSALFGISVTNFVYYYWYEWTRAGFEKAAVTAGRASKKLTTVESMIAGAIAGSATVLLTNPIWVVNTRMTTRKRNNEADEGLLPGSKPANAPSTVGTLLALLKEEGPQALFAGVVPALVLVINPILQYTIFEQLKNVLEKKRRVTPTMAFLLGAFGKLIATTLTYPYITVKSRMHVAGKDSQKENMMDGMRRIIREEGYVGFYKGMITEAHKAVAISHSVTNNSQELHPRSPRVSSQRHSCSLSKMFCTRCPSKCENPPQSRHKYLRR